MNSVVKDAELVPPVGTRSAEVEVALSRADPVRGSSLEFWHRGQRGFSVRPGTLALIAESFRFHEGDGSTHKLPSEQVIHPFNNHNGHVESPWSGRRAF
jgi:hypothetical protein